MKLLSFFGECNFFYILWRFWEFLIKVKVGIVFNVLIILILYLNLIVIIDSLESKIFV